jgi:hypothetical protein
MIAGLCIFEMTELRKSLGKVIFTTRVIMRLVLSSLFLRIIVIVRAIS